MVVCLVIDVVVRPQHGELSVEVTLASVGNVSDHFTSVSSISLIQSIVRCLHSQSDGAYVYDVC